MKSFLAVSLVIFVLIASSAFSSDTPAPARAGDQAEQIKLLAKIEKLEKRMAALEKENKEIRHEFNLLTSYTEIGVPLDVERAMMIPSPKAALR